MRKNDAQGNKVGLGSFFFFSASQNAKITLKIKRRKRRATLKMPSIGIMQGLPKKKKKKT